MELEATQSTAPQGKWQTFDDDEQLPLLLSRTFTKSNDVTKSEPASADFEFLVSAGGGRSPGHDMCAADEVFLNGQILPLRPSVSSGPSRCGSQSNSADRFSSTTTSRSNSSSRSSNCVSRSHSSNSSRSSARSNNFYAHPSPKPQLRPVRRACAARRSAGSAPPGWGILRLGLIRAPPRIELYDARPWRLDSGSRKSDAEVASGASKRFDACSSEGKVEKKVPWFARHGFGCGRAPDAVEPSAELVVDKNKKKKEEDREGLRRADSICRTRIFEWLEDLSIAKLATGGGGGVGGGGGH